MKDYEKHLKKLRDKGEYFRIHPDCCCLDGYFTIKDLKAIIKAMEFGKDEIDIMNIKIIRPKKCLKENGK